MSQNLVLSIKLIHVCLSEELRATVKKHGLLVATVLVVIRKIIWNYKSLVGVANNATALAKVSHKPGTRHVAENSRMYTICYFILVTNTHYLLVNLKIYITKRNLVKQVKELCYLDGWYLNATRIHQYTQCYHHCWSQPIILLFLYSWLQ